MRQRQTVRAAAVVSVFLALASIATAGQIELTWDAVPGAQGYTVYYGSSPGSYSASVNVSGGATSATVTGLADCHTYHLAVKAYNTAGQSPQYSNEVMGWARPEIVTSTIQAAQGSQFTLDITGANFDPAAQVTLDAASLPTDLAGNPLVRFESIQVSSCNQIQMLVTVEATARGFRAMEVGGFTVGADVQNPDGVFGARSLALDVTYDSARADINRSDLSTQDRVDGQDLTWLAYGHGHLEGEPRYNPDADLDGNGEIDGNALALLATDFGLCRSGNAWTACP